ncbi:MAG: LemA family protein [Bacteroidota bacterium]|jgi:LemA protein|nr:LemA family protein [Ignavibacteria bacterium]HEX2961451.1 LemA family protein [Ignavibacteriales bacterium]MCU7499826.1 LemA family protein [Ignavibacteria bacterium]MCU7513281.1 LemA family protein [Ignavibacteria bacterium]MCU7522156.1 LemA family protein [Ignavibacteria bacterium]
MKRGVLVGCSIAGVILVIIIGLVMWGVGVYNSLVSLNESVNQSWSQVENQYQRRADLIPNLVNTVKGYANFEKEVLTRVTEARASVNQIKLTPEMLSDPQAFQRFQSAQGNLSNALSRLLVTVENYPNLKANENFLQLQAQLEGTENRIAVERMKFNQVVQEYNTRIKRFPAFIFANMSGFREKQYFKSAPGAETAPKVEF